MSSPSEAGEKAPRQPKAGRDSQRLQVEIAVCGDELARREIQPPEPVGPWLATAQEQPDRASEKLKGGDLLAARRWLMAAQQSRVPGLTPAELRAEAIELRAQARTEMRGWQSAAIEHLLSASKEDLPTAVRAALEIRDARLLDAGTEAGRRHNQLGRRLVALFAFIGAILGLAFLRVGHLDLGTVAGVIAFGALGGAFSTAIATHQGDPTPSTNEGYISDWVTWSRPAIGAAGALGAYAFLSAGVGVAVSNPLAIFAIAFAAGFSERLVASAAEGTTIP